MDRGFEKIYNTVCSKDIQYGVSNFQRIYNNFQNIYNMFQKINNIPKIYKFVPKIRLQYIQKIKNVFPPCIEPPAHLNSSHGYFSHNPCTSCTVALLIN
jgi:hypothetical protein